MAKKIKIELDAQTADNITLLNLKEHRSYLKKTLKDFDKGAYVHPEDVENITRVIQSLNLLIKHFGG
jgi:hypothetical protein